MQIYIHFKLSTKYILNWVSYYLLLLEEDDGDGDDEDDCDGKLEQGAYGDICEGGLMFVLLLPCWIEDDCGGDKFPAYGDIVWEELLLLLGLWRIWCIRFMENLYEDVKKDLEVFLTSS